MEIKVTVQGALWGPAASSINQRVDEHLHSLCDTRERAESRTQFVEIDDVTP